MIRLRNPNKVKQVNQNKQKKQKIQIKCKKETVETDVEENQNKISLNLEKNIAPIRPKKVSPKFQLEVNTKDQVQEYEDQIITYLKSLQQKYKIDENYIKFHKCLTLKARNSFLKYMFKIIWKFRCKRSTLYLAIYCWDYYLSKNFNIQDNNQVIVIAQASLNIAMKYEQIYPPQLKEWTNDAAHIKRILQVEAQILKTIDFKLNLPSIVYFQQYFQKKFCQSDRYILNKENLYLEEQKIQLISDLCLFDISLYEYSPLDLAQNIRRLVYNIQTPFTQQRIALNIKWALQRNKEYLQWLKQTKYKQFLSS